MTTTLMNDANNAGTLAPCEFCGTYPNPNDPPCATLEQAYARTEVRPFGCPYFTDSDRKMYPLSTPNALSPATEVLARPPSDDLLAFAIVETFGERCQTVDTDCYTCQAWAQYDAILAVRLDEAAIRKDGAYLDFFEQNLGMELSCSWEDDDGPWQVHNVTGGRNDREWTLVGQGRTPREAIASAIRNGGKQP